MPTPSPLTLVPTDQAARARALAAPVRVRSWTGTTTRIHSPANHGPWLSIALFLECMPRQAAPVSAGKRSAAETGAALGAVVCGVPDGNHGDNDSLTDKHAQEVSR